MLHYSLDLAFFPSPFAQCTEEFLVGDSVGDACIAQPAHPTQPTKQHPLLPLLGHKEPGLSNPCFAKKKPCKGGKKPAAAGMVLSLHPEKVVVDLARLGNHIKGGVGKRTLNIANVGLPFSCSRALSLGGTVHHSFVPSPNSSLLCPLPGLDILLVNIVF